VTGVQTCALPILSSFIYSNYLTNDFNTKQNIVTTTTTNIKLINDNLTISNNRSKTDIVKYQKNQIQKQIQLSLGNIQVLFDQLNLTYGQAISPIDIYKDSHKNEKPQSSRSSRSSTVENSKKDTIKIKQQSNKGNKSNKGKHITTIKNSKGNKNRKNTNTNSIENLKIIKYVYEDDYVRIYYVNGKKHVDYSIKFIKSYLKQYPEDFEELQAKYPDHDLSQYLEL
jgi:hypothetical protein